MATGGGSTVGQVITCKGTHDSQTVIILKTV